MLKYQRNSLSGDIPELNNADLELKNLDLDNVIVKPITYDSKEIMTMGDQTVSTVNTDYFEPNEEKSLRKNHSNAWKFAFFILLAVMICGSVLIISYFALTSSPSPSNSLPTIPGTELLQIEIPIDRTFDVQWNPPGYPLLRADRLRPPYFDRTEQRDGYYTFDIQDGNIVGFVRRRSDGSVLRVFDEVEFISISNDVLMFNGNPNDGRPAGGGYGTIVKAPSIASGSAGGNWLTESVTNSDMTPGEWLLQNFNPSFTAPPTRQHKELLEVEIPVDRAFDVQWNPPGHPLLRANLLRPPYFDRAEERDGYYTFDIQDGNIAGFVRKRSDGSVLQVFDEVEFILISDYVLMFNGNPNDGRPAGGGYGTIIKAPSIASGSAGGHWLTESVTNSDMTPEEWLMSNF